MGGLFGVASKQDCVFDLFFGTDYHSHLGTKRAGMVVHGENGFQRAIHNIENSPFRTKFERDIEEMKGNLGYRMHLRQRASAADGSFPSGEFRYYHGWPNQ